jgi:predicted RNase H-like HicB family nuclease
MTLECIVTRDEDGVYCAEVPSLPGCVTDGRTLEELRSRLADAVGLYLEDMAAERAERQSSKIDGLRSFSFSVLPHSLSAPRHRRVAAVAK